MAAQYQNNDTFTNRQDFIEDMDESMPICVTKSSSINPNIQTSQQTIQNPLKSLQNQSTLNNSHSNESIIQELMRKIKVMMNQINILSQENEKIIEQNQLLQKQNVLINEGFINQKQRLEKKFKSKYLKLFQKVINIFAILQQQKNQYKDILDEKYYLKNYNIKLLNEQQEVLHLIKNPQVLESQQITCKKQLESKQIEIEKKYLEQIQLLRNEISILQQNQTQQQLQMSNLLNEQLLERQKNDRNLKMSQKNFNKKIQDLQKENEYLVAILTENQKKMERMSIQKEDQNIQEIKYFSPICTEKKQYQTKFEQYCSQILTIGQKDNKNKQQYQFQITESTQPKEPQILCKSNQKKKENIQS